MQEDVSSLFLPLLLCLSIALDPDLLGILSLQGPEAFFLLNLLWNQEIFFTFFSLVLIWLYFPSINYCFESIPSSFHPSIRSPSLLDLVDDPF